MLRCNDRRLRLYEVKFVGYIVPAGVFAPGSDSRTVALANKCRDGQAQADFAKHEAKNRKNVLGGFCRQTDAANKGEINVGCII